MYRSKAYKLSSIKEIKEWTGFLKRTEADAEKAVIKLEKLEAEARDVWQFFMKTRNDIHSNWSGSLAVLRDFEKNAKKLGIDNPNSIPEYAALEKQARFAKEVVDEMDRYNKPKIF